VSDNINEREEIEITDNQLSVIKEEIDHTRFNLKLKRSPSYTKIFKNIIVGIIMIAYIYLLIVGYEIIGVESYFKALNILQYVLVGLGVLLIEISYQKNKVMISTHGIEAIMLSIITLVLINLFSKNYLYISKFEIGCIIFVTIYFLIKSVLIRYIDYKKEVTKKEEKA
jgi:hypothetical protein